MLSKHHGCPSENNTSAFPLSLLHLWLHSNAGASEGVGAGQLQGCGSFRGGAASGRGRWEAKAPSPHGGFLSQGLDLTGEVFWSRLDFLNNLPKHVTILTTGDGQKPCMGKDVAQGGVKES